MNSSHAQKSWRPFSSDSPWNVKIPSNAPIDSQSSRFIDDLSKGDFFVNIDNWSIPVYYINSDSVPKVNVINSRPAFMERVLPNPIIFPSFPISSHHLPSEILAIITSAFSTHRK
jgi:hypothetical protein